MSNKVMIFVALIVVALAINGTETTAAINNFGPQDFRQGPAAPKPLEPVLAGESGEEVREEFHQTYALSATGRVSLENLNGNVQIKVWDRPAVQLDAVKRAYRKERLSEVRIEVNSTEENIRIKTEYPDWNQTFRSDDRRYDNPALVDYTLTVPRKAILESIELVNGSLDVDGAEGSVKASSINGRLTARNLLGEAKLSTINGSLNASFTQLDEAKPITLGSVNGSVTLIIPSNSNAMIRAGTVHGAITNDFGLQVKDGDYVGHNLDGQIGNGGPKIKLGNVNGGIRITHAQDGFAISSVTSIAIEKEKIKKEAKIEMDADIARQIEQANETASAAAARAAEASRVTLEAQRRVDDELRRAQREVERAQLQIQRQMEREQVRVEVGRSRGVGSSAGAGSGAGAGAGAGSGSGRSYDGRLTSQETKSFTVTGTPRVVLSTFDGPITVHGWDKAEVSYTATKRAEDDESLKSISIQSQQNGSEISINARCESDSNASAQLEVYVPRNTSLHVSSDDGALKLDKVSGDIILRTGDGSIEVAEGAGTLQVNTGDGRVQVISFNGQVDARTGDGSLSLDGNFNEVAARTGDGAITLTVPQGSNFTVETNADNEVTNQGLNMTEEIAPSRRFKRWSIGSGGKVFILKTGDGRILVRSR